MGHWAGEEAEQEQEENGRNAQTPGKPLRADAQD
jgi:hypothetical protein